MILLDTCALSDLLRKKEKSLTYFSNYRINQVYISTISCFEIEYGFAKKPIETKQYIKPYQAIFKKLKVLQFTSKQASLAANLRDKLEKLGEGIGPYDTLIAATALYQNLTLITSNEKEFNRVPNLKIQNWRH